MWLPECRGRRHRTFMMGGAPWRVYEDRNSPAIDGTSLVFFGPGVARRVRAYPSNWEALDDATLCTLSLSR
jgi:hypothetical protein